MEHSRDVLTFGVLNADAKSKWDVNSVRCAMTSRKTCYADIVKCLGRRWPRDAEFSNASGDSLTLTMGDDQFTINLLDPPLKF
jgi:hypothetical protein